MTAVVLSERKTPLYNSALRDAMSPHFDYLINGQVLVSFRANIANVFGGHSVVSRFHQFIHADVVVAQILQLAHKFRRDSMVAHGNQLRKLDVIHARRAHFFHVAPH